jgi:hypothetical protein
VTETSGATQETRDEARGGEAGERPGRPEPGGKNLPAWDHPDIVVVLAGCDPEKLATKRFEPDPTSPTGWTVESYGLASCFDAYRYYCPTVVDLYRLLRGANAKPRCFVMRGALRPGLSPDYVRRTKHADPKTGEAPFFHEVARSWVAFDFDSVEVPEGLDPLDAEGAGKHLRGLLPPEFRNVSCVVQATSSAGMKEGLRYRLWFHLSRPLTGDELEGWSKGYPCDPAVFRTVEPIYTAKPIFDPPLEDPVERRVVPLLGELETVPVPAELPGQEAGGKRRRARGAGTGEEAGASGKDGAEAGDGAADIGDEGEDTRPVGFEGWLSRIGDGPGLLGFRRPMQSALACYANYYGAELLRLYADRLRERIKAAFDAAPKRPDRGDDLERYLSPEHYGAMIEWIAERQELSDTLNPPTWQRVATREVERVNFDYFATYVGSDAMVGREDRATRGLEFIKPASFRLMMDRRKVVMSMTGDPPREKLAGLGSLWLGREDRRSYDGVRLMPGRPREVVEPGGRRYFNSWQGWGLTPKAGDWSRIEYHLLEVICRGNRGHYEHLLSWLALGVQFPAEPAGSMIVLQGRQGTGKGSLYRLMARIYGAHATQITQSRQLTGHFNAHLGTALFLFADEAMWAGDREGAGVLKGLATELTIQLERKGVDVETVPNRLKIMIASNSPWVVPADGDDRRAFVLEVSEEKARDPGYFKALVEAIDGDEAPAFFHALLERDLSTFDRWNPPHTAALANQKIHSLKVWNASGSTVSISARSPGRPARRGPPPSRLATSTGAILRPARSGTRLRCKSSPPASAGCSAAGWRRVGRASTTLSAESSTCCRRSPRLALTSWRK